MTPGLKAVMDDPQFDPKKLMQTWTENIPMGRVGEAWGNHRPCPVPRL